MVRDVKRNVTPWGRGGVNESHPGFLRSSTCLTTIASYTGSAAFSSNVTTLYRFSPSVRATAIFDCGFSYYDASLSASVTKPLMTLLLNQTGDDYNKAYLSPIETAADIAIVENDEIISYQKRIVLPSSSVNDIGGAAGVSGSSGGMYGEHKGLYGD